MKRSVFLLVSFSFAFPAMGLAEERLTCGEYLAMDSEAKLAAIETVKASLAEAGQGFHFADDAADADKLAYVDGECTNDDAWDGLALFDVLGE